MLASLIVQLETKTILIPTGEQDYRSPNITLLPGVGTTGDTLRVYAIKDGQYAYGYWDSEGEFESTIEQYTWIMYMSLSDIITVYTFNNDSVQEIERQEFDVVERTKLTVGSEDWYRTVTFA